MNSKTGISNVNFVEVANTLQSATSAYEKVWQSLIGYSPCLPCLTLYLHKSNVAHRAKNLIRLLHNPLGYQHLMHIEEIQSEIKDIINEAHKRNSDFFKCKHLKGNSEVETPRKGCNCRKSLCAKKYCECFQAGLPCNENCCCTDCKNPNREDKEVKEISFTPTKKELTNISSPNFLENVSKLLVKSLKAPKYSEIMKTISSAPQTLNSLSSLLNNDRRNSMIPSFPLLSKESSLDDGRDSKSSNSHSVLPNNLSIPFNNRASVMFDNTDDRRMSGEILKIAKSASVKLLTPKAKYSTKAGMKRKTTWLEVSSDEGAPSQDFVNKNSYGPSKKSKIDYVSLFNKIQQRKDLSVLDEFAATKRVGLRSAFNPRSRPRKLLKKELKSYDAPLRVKNQELSSAESESMVECPPSSC